MQAGDGESGLEMFCNTNPDLVLLDVNIPRMSGFEVLREIRLVSDVPVIMLTARDEEMDQVRGLQLGADEYLQKPIGHATLVAAARGPEDIQTERGLGYRFVNGQKSASSTPLDGLENVGSVAPPSVWLSVDRIDPSPETRNVRRVYSQVRLRELADSIREYGVLEPILVNLVEDAQRAELNAAERVGAVRQLASAGLGVREIALGTGVSAATISRWIRIARNGPLLSVLEDGASIYSGHCTWLASTTPLSWGELIEVAPTPRPRGLLRTGSATYCC